MRCDYIAEGVIKATKDLDLKVPLIVRLKGTKEEEAKKWVCCLHVVPILIGFFLSKFRLIRDSGLKIFAFDELDEAAEQAVQASKA